MKSLLIRRGMLASVFVALACSAGGEGVGSASEEWTLDRRSWNQGTYAAMAEMVDYGVKRIALSASFIPEEMDLYIDDAIEISGRHNVQVFREDDFLVTDLFSEALTEGKHVLFLCHDSTWQEYEALKADKMKLIEAGDYEGEARTEIARRFGRLLSYPEATIEKELVQ